MQSELLKAVEDDLTVQEREQLNAAPDPLLCCFDEGGSHEVIAPLSSTVTLEEFKAAAFAVLAKRLGDFGPPQPYVPGQSPSLGWRHLALLAAGVGLVIAVYIAWKKPNTSGYSYDDCILANMGSATNNYAAWQIEHSCAAKYPRSHEQSPDPVSSVALKPDEVKNITGTGAVVGRYFSGSLYNGNRDVTVTQVEIAVTIGADSSAETKTYLEFVNVRPMQATNVSFQIIPAPPGSKLRWGVVSAEGHRK